MRAIRSAEWKETTKINTQKQKYTRILYHVEYNLYIQMENKKLNCAQQNIWWLRTLNPYLVKWLKCCLPIRTWPLVFDFANVYYEFDIRRNPAPIIIAPKKKSKLYNNARIINQTIFWFGPFCLRHFWGILYAVSVLLNCKNPSAIHAYAGRLMLF